ncbi:MAG: HPF/RaiA family ribosome-associated protein [Burkholderiales bacterium]|nr:HPF/RaiA family ribosome-associated protein [Burkholderiales bacterium]
MRIDIHACRIALSDELRELIQRRASFALSRVASRLTRLELHLADINGPRGGVDKRCGVLIHLDHGPALFVERTGDELPALIDRCFASASRAVRKRVQQESLQRFLPRHEAAAVLAAQESGR